MKTLWKVIPVAALVAAGVFGYRAVSGGTEAINCCCGPDCPCEVCDCDGTKCANCECVACDCPNCECDKCTAEGCCEKADCCEKEATA